LSCIALELFCEEKFTSPHVLTHGDRNCTRSSAIPGSPKVLAGTALRWTR